MSGLAGAVRDPAVVSRYQDKVVRVAASDCWWWIGAISGAGHGRFWIAAGHVVIAHRFAYALAAGADQAARTPILSHRCDNPLCQRVGPNHLVASTASQNRREWSIRRHIAGLPLSDPRGPRGRAEALRALMRANPSAVHLDHQQFLARVGEQGHLF